MTAEDHMSVNPYELLRLDPSATEEEIVRQAGRLRQRANDEAARDAIRRAVQALTARAEDRRLLALLTHPSPRHRRPALDRFAAAFRRPPAADAPPPRPEMDMGEWETLLRALAAEETEVLSPAFEIVPTDDSPEELRAQTAEAVWLSLPLDPGA